ncbi:MAG: iron-sulfur cluster assembly protein [Proteobacteria bacterium]|nr:iron-sulfur cluster assembly protein [Pseudomonadota bacterium]
MSEAAIRAALARVPDPELAESIIDLGLVAAVACDPGRWQVTLIPTSATCPMADALLEDAQAALAAIAPADVTVSVQMDWDTPWSPDRMAPALRQRLGWA